jgi:hypothetical protein
VQAHIHPTIVQFVSTLVPRVHGSLPGQCLDAHGLPETAEYPEPLCPVWALPTTGGVPHQRNMAVTYQNLPLAFLLQC